MKWFETIIVAILSSGVTATLIEYFFNNHRDEQKRRLEFLEKQLTNLYGPLYWLISQSEKLFELHDKIMNAYMRNIAIAVRDMVRRKTLKIL